MPENTARFLGFAFANSDYLFEIDRNNTVVFAMGAASEFLPKGVFDMKGQGAARFFQPSDGAKFATFAQAITDGMRAGPFKLKLASGKDVSLGMFRLPDNQQRISCTLTHPGLRAAFQGADPKTGLQGRDGFMGAVASIATAKDTLALVELPDLPKVCAKLGEEKADKLMQQIGENLVASGAKAAARISDTGFGAVKEDGESGFLASAVRKALDDGGVAADMNIAETLVSLKSSGLTVEQKMQAVKHVIEKFAAEGRAPKDLLAALDEASGVRRPAKRQGVRESWG